MTKRHYGVLWLIGVLLLSLAVPVWAAPAKKKVSIWGLSSLSAGNQRAVDQFNASHSNVELLMETQVSNFSGQTIDSISKLLISIAAGVPPAITTVDRFIVGGVAGRGALLPLDDFMKRANVNPNDWYPAVLAEARYKGKLYALPSGTDNRALYYNQFMFSNAGLDPRRPPQTWDELAAVNRKLTKIGGDGKYVQVGFDPLYSQGHFYIWGWQNGGEWLSEDGRKALLNDRHLVEALDYVVRLYDDIGGYQSVRGFLNSLGKDPFINQVQAMRVDGNWYLGSLASAIDQDFDWSVTPVPVPADRMAQKGRFAGQPPFITWSGGWSWAIPVGVQDPELAFDAVAFLTTQQGHLANAEGSFADRQSKKQPFVPGMTGHRAADQALLEKYVRLLPDKFARAQQLFINLLAVTRFRPITPLAPELWKAQADSAMEAVQHKAPPAAVLEDWNRRLQAQLDAYYQRGELSTGE